jgi:AraC-like DNA-binding protein
MIQVDYKILQPSPHLQPFIKDYTLLYFLSEEKDAIPVKPFPANTEHCIVFYLHGHVTAMDSGKTATVYPRIAINGTQLSRFDFHISSHFQMLSVQFQPGVLSKFLGTPLMEFTDVRIDAEAVLNPAIRQVHEHMSNAPSSQALLAILETYLWKRINSLKMDFLPIDKVAYFLSGNPVGWSIEKIAATACLSISQFERRFTKLQGVTPKLYLRINRFFTAYKLKEQHPDWDWLRIAVHTGYHDYQHLVKDFKQFAHTTPHSLLLAQANSPDGLFSASKIG